MSEDSYYPSPPQQSLQNDKVKQFSVLVIAEVIFILCILLIVGILNYLNLLPLSKTFPGTLGFLPHKTTLQTLKQTPQRNTYSYTKKGFLVTAVSDVPDYTLEIRDKQKLLTLLSEWGLYEKDFTNKISNRSIYTVNLHLSTGILPNMIVTDKQRNPLVYSDIKVNNGTLEAFVSLSKTVLDENSRNRALFFQNGALISLYLFTKNGQVASQDAKSQNELIAVFKKLSESNTILFSIRKK